MKKYDIEIDIKTSGRLMGHYADALDAIRERSTDGPTIEMTKTLEIIITLMIEEQLTLSRLLAEYKSAID